MTGIINSPADLCYNVNNQNIRKHIYIGIRHEISSKQCDFEALLPFRV